MLLRNPWKGETLRINRPAAVRAASLGTHFALGFVTGCVRVFGSCAPFGVAMAARSGGGLGGSRASLVRRPGILFPARSRGGCGIWRRSCSCLQRPFSCVKQRSRTGRGLCPPSPPP